MPGGILAWSAAKPYYRTRKETTFHWTKEGEKIECWGPFGFVIDDLGVSLHSLDEPSHEALFWAPSREQAIALAKAATALNLNWREFYGEQGRRYEQRTLDGIAKLILDFKDVIRWRSDLFPQPPEPEPLPELPSAPNTKPLEISLATKKGPRSILAYVIAEHFAIHRPLDPRECGYVITHAPTGYKIGQCDDLQACLDAISGLATLEDWGFTSLEQVSSRFRIQIPQALEVLNRCNVTPTQSHATVTTRTM